MGDLYLNIVESKNRDSGGFDRQSVILFAEDLQEFLKGFDESLKVLEKAARGKKHTGGESSPRRSAPRLGGGAGKGSARREEGREHTNRSEKRERANERGDRTERGERHERSERHERGDRTERGERYERGERGEKRGRTGEHSGRSFRGGERGKNADRGGRNDRGSKDVKRIVVKKKDM